MTKRAFITGVQGFVGRHMFDELVSRGYEVAGCDIKQGPQGDLMYLLNDREFNELDDYDWDLVVHCAYHVGGRAGIDGHPEYLARNVALDAALFDWAASAGRVGRVLYFSSSAIYPTSLQGVDRPAVRLSEDAAGSWGTDRHGDWDWAPDARYGWAKMNGEVLAQAARELGLGVTVVRPFSGYAADQGSEYPFPAVIARAKGLRDGDEMADRFTVWGPPWSTRDWIHISDVVKGALAVNECQAGECTPEHPTQHDQPGWVTEPVNLCTGVATSFESLARKAMIAAGINPPLEVSGLANKPTGVMHRVGDLTRLRTYYWPQVKLDDAIREAMA